MQAISDPRAAFIDAACAPLDAGHASGTLDEPQAILARHPEVAASDIHTAAILGDDSAVRRYLGLDQSKAREKSAPRGWDALTHLCFSKYLRLDPARSDGFVRAATALLDAGADANTGWFENNHQPSPEWESAIYGAAGVAHHAGMTRLLLERGADPNDGETPYHAPETHDNDALKALVLSGKLNEDSLATLLLRKTDWHDFEGVNWLLEQGVDPNRTTHWGKTALHNAVLSDNSIEIIKTLLDHGADPTLVATRPERSPRNQSPRSALSLAARRGRGDVLNLFEQRGFPIALEGVERLIVACARDDGAAVSSIARNEPELVSELVAQGGKLLAEFSGVGNTDGDRHLLELGVDINARYEGDGYFGIARNSTALHVAAWRANHSTVKFLIERGADINARDGDGHTPIQLAVRACVASYWTYRRSSESVEALLRAGARASDVPLPVGYAPVDELLKSFGQQSQES